MKTAVANAQTESIKPKRPRVITPFDECKAAQNKLDRIEQQRREVIDGLSDEAAAMLEALDELRAKQTIEMPESKDSGDEEQVSE